MARTKSTMVAKQRALSQVQRKQVRTIARKEVTQGSETRHYYVKSGSTSVDSTGSNPTPISLSAMAIGDTANQRQGDQADPISLTVRGQLVAGDATNKVRILVFRWHANTVPNTNEVLLDILTNGVDSPIHHDNRGLFSLLYDKRISLDTYNPVKLFGFKLWGRKIGSKKIIFNDGSTTGTDKFYMIVLSDSGAVPHVDLSYYTDLAYKDL